MKDIDLLPRSRLVALKEILQKGETVMSVREVLDHAHSKARDQLVAAYHEQRIRGWWWQTAAHVGLLLPDATAMTVELPDIGEVLERLTPREGREKSRQGNAA